MTRDEFKKRFIPSLGSCYPQIVNWFTKLDVSVTDQWVSALSKVDVNRACTLITFWFQNDKHPWRETSDWQMIPVMVRKALSNLDEEASQYQKNRSTDYQKPKVLAEMSDAFEKLKSLNPDQRIEYIESNFPIDPDDRRGWKKCNICRDEGTILVWNPHTVLEIKKTETASRKYKTLVRCECGCNPIGRTLIVFNPQIMCRWINESIEEVLEWLSLSGSQRIEKATGRKAFEEHAEFI